MGIMERENKVNTSVTSSKERIAQLEEIIGYTFKDKNLLMQALTHSSYANERKINKIACNERLEFLGDAILEMVSSNFLFLEFPDMAEGELSGVRASLVCEPALADVANKIHLGEFLLLGKGEDACGGRKKASVISDAFEAMLGAVYLDGGYDAVKEIILRYVLSDTERGAKYRDSKSVLQEYVQQTNPNGVISYAVVGETGPEHDKIFCVEVFVDGISCGKGEGKTKKAAQKEAAREALENMKKPCKK